MFGMLDYRAHKLYWLLGFPFRLLSWILTIVIIIASCEWVFTLVDNVILRFILSYIVMEIATIIFSFLWMCIVVRCFDAVFHFLIDVEPAEGRTKEQAREVLIHGAVAAILQKPHSKLTIDDCESLVRGLWINKFFASKIRRRLQILCKRAQELALETGSDVSLSDHELMPLLKTEGLTQPWYEVALCHVTIRAAIIIHILFIVIFITLILNGHSSVTDTENTTPSVVGNNKIETPQAPALGAIPEGKKGMITGQALSECVFMAAQTYAVPPSVILGVLQVEGGKVGMASPNANGSFDLGPMQINTIWVPELSRYWGTGESRALQVLRDDACVNISVGAWILRSKMNETGSLYKSIAHYHSALRDLRDTYDKQYRQKVLNAMHRYYQVHTVEGLVDLGIRK